MLLPSAHTETKPKRPHWVRSLDRRSAVRRLGAALCLLAWLVSTSGFIPALAASLAEIDPQHRVSVVQDESGTRVLLQHDVANLHHRHHLVARMLVACAVNRGAGDADHVLNFGGATAQEAASAAVVAPGASEDQVSPPVDGPVLLRIEPVVFRFTAARPPPDTPPSAVLIARSTTRQI